MQIYMVAMNRTPAMLDFERYALDHGCDLRLAHPDGVVPDFDEKTSGVLVFTEGSVQAAKWVENIRYQARYLSLPVVAVISSDWEKKEQLLSAGATAVFDGASPASTIISELASWRSAEPMLDERNIALVEPFNKSTITTFQEMAQVSVRVRAIYQQKSHKMFGDISAVIGLISKFEGAMVISFPQRTADEVSHRILKDVSDEVSEDMLRDCIGEIANVIAGHARGKLANTPNSFGMSTPTVISGSGHQIRHKPGAPCLVSAFTSEIGDFALQVCLGA